MSYVICRPLGRGPSRIGSLYPTEIDALDSDSADPVHLTLRDDISVADTDELR